MSTGPKIWGPKIENLDTHFPTLRARLARLAGPVRSLTFDGGSESAKYAPIESALGAKSCFAGPYCAWQRGSNENTNGLIRQCVPRNRDISTLTDADFDRIERKLNNRPRNTPGIRAPSEVRLRTQQRAAHQS